MKHKQYVGNEIYKYFELQDYNIWRILYIHNTPTVLQNEVFLLYILLYHELMNYHKILTCIFYIWFFTIDRYLHIQVPVM